MTTEGLQSIVDGVESRVGRHPRLPLETATRAALRALGSQLGGVPPALHDLIPAALHQALEAGRDDQPTRPSALYQQVATATGMRVGLALEIVQSAVAELGARIGESGRQQLRAALSPAWQALVIEPRGPGRTAGGRDDAGASLGGHTLATGRPGGTRPLTEASLPAGQSNSIAASDDPHAERLATAKGPGPHRADGTLSQGRPGSRHAVADSD